MVLRMIDGAARCLEEEVVRTAGELDLAMIFGTGFPPFRGGPCKWADRQGLGWVIETLGQFATAGGERYRPSEALVRTKEAGGFYGWFGGMRGGKAERAAASETEEPKPESVEAG